MSRSGDTSAATTVDYATVDGSTKQKGDFEYAAGQLAFAAGETSKTFPLLINEDMYVEGNESFNVTLSNPVGATLGQQSTTTVTISDDAPESISNPLDDPQSFVLDALSRFPESGTGPERTSVLDQRTDFVWR